MAAYAIFFMVLVVLGVGMITIFLNVGVNEGINVINPFISDGSMSTQWVMYWNLAIGLLIALPFLILIALAAWMIVRAIERRQEQV